MIERVGAAAAEALAAIHAAVFPRGWSVADLTKILQNPAAFALLDSERQGFVLAWAVPGEAEVLTLAVRPESRRRGLGGALMSAAGAEARARHADAMFLEVAEDNQAARAFYARLGFAEAGMRPGYYAGGAVNAVVMRRALPL